VLTLRQQHSANRNENSKETSNVRHQQSKIYLLNNFIHHKSGSNEYKDEQTNITQLTLSSTYINRNICWCLVGVCQT